MICYTDMLNNLNLTATWVSAVWYLLAKYLKLTVQNLIKFSLGEGGNIIKNTIKIIY